MLFSEPKIPQCCQKRARRPNHQTFQCSSASRKFLNTSRRSRARARPQTFQCSSASRKFLNFRSCRSCFGSPPRFSALQRAENSSIVNTGERRRLNVEFQCSSASRKFLNSDGASHSSVASGFQCSSASRKFLNQAALRD